MICIAAGAWVAAAVWLVPGLIRQGHAGSSIPAINAIFSGRDVHDVGFYLGMWRRWAAVGTFMVAGLSAVGFSVVRYRASIRKAFRYDRWWSPAPVGDVLLISAWFGWWTGLMEFSYRFGTDAFSLRPSEVQAEDLWLAPVAGTVAFLLLALALSLAVRLAKRPHSLRPALVLGLGLLAFSALRLLELGIHPLAAALLALGLAVQLSRPLAAWQTGLTSLVRRTAVAMCALTALAAITIPVAESWRERRALAGLPAAAAGAPNVLLLILDTVRAQSLGLYGAARPTSPSIERLAERGVVFERAYAPAPWTLPSHATLFTGLWPHQHRATWGRRLVDGVAPTLAEVMADEGYATGGFVANMVFTARGSGLDRGFHHYRDAPLSWSRLLGASPLLAWPFERVRLALGNHRRAARKPAAVVNQELLEWLDGYGSDRPFFAFLNYFDSHLPYGPPAPFDTLFTAPGDRYWAIGNSRQAALYSEEELHQLRASYEEAVAYVDHQVGRLMEALDSRGLRNNTIVIVTSDHGEQFGEHGVIGHSNSLYDPVTRIPLVIADPRSPGLGGRRIAAPVSLRDVPATILDLVGASGGLPGRSLRGHWMGGASPEPILMQNDRGFERLSMLGVVDGDWKYVRTFRAEVVEELYQVVSDPAEATDLALTADARETGSPLARLRFLADSLAGRPEVEPGS